MRLKTALVALLAVLVIPARAGKSDDWPQWRGPGRDAAWRETGILKEFPPNGLKVCWRTAVGPGWSSPVVANGRVYLTDAELKSPDARERVLCLEEATGKPLWAHSYEVGYPDWAFTQGPGRGPTATPIGDAALLYTDKGELIRARLTETGYQEQSRIRLLEPTTPFSGRNVAWPPPAYANRRIYVRNDKVLFCASLSAE